MSIKSTLVKPHEPHHVYFNKACQRYPLKRGDYIVGVMYKGSFMNVSTDFISSQCKANAKHKLFQAMKRTKWVVQ